MLKQAKLFHVFVPDSFLTFSLYYCGYVKEHKDTIILVVARKFSENLKR